MGVTGLPRTHNALKCFQLGQFVLAGFQPGKARPAVLRADDLRVPVLAGRLARNSATACALLQRAPRGPSPRDKNGSCRWRPGPGSDAKEVARMARQVAATRS